MSTTSNPTAVYLITDRPDAHRQLRGLKEDLRIQFGNPALPLDVTTVAPFDTVSVGYWAARLALGQGVPGRIVYFDVSTGLDDDGTLLYPRPDGLLASRLPNDVLVVGPNIGSSWSFLRDHALIRELPLSHVPGGLARQIKKLATGEIEFDRLKLITSAIIPDLSKHSVVDIDSKGNITTSWIQSPVPAGQRVKIKVGQTSRVALVADDFSGDAPDQLLFRRSSSLWSLAGGARIRLFEVVAKVGSAAEALAVPKVEDRHYAGDFISIEPVQVAEPAFETALTGPN